MLRPQFARDQISDLEVEEVHVQNLIRRIKSDESGWTKKLDLQPLFFSLTLDSATEFLFGETVNSQLIDRPTKRDQNGKVLDWGAFGQDWDNATAALGKRGRLADLYWLYSPSSFAQSCKRIHEFANYYVNLALKPTEKSDGKYVFLHALAEQTQDPTELRSQLLNILLAGRDTTAGLLGEYCLP